MPAKRGRGARVKGSAFERKLGKLLSDHTGLEWKRGLGQTRKGGKEVSDVMCETDPRWHVEAKRQVRCSIKSAVKQATTDTLDTDKTPIIITKDDREPILVTMYFEDWIELFSHYVQNKKISN
jgi:hypothetical protein